LHPPLPVTLPQLLTRWHAGELHAQRLTQG